MAKILGYIATSLDGFIATDEDSLDWLFMYNDLELGEYDYRQFIKRIRTVVMGRGTYDFLEKDGSPWAYGEQRVLVVTSRPIAAPTIAENITLAPRTVKKLDKGAALKLAQAALAQVGLAEKADNYPEQLSGGQQQRAAIARSLAMQPQVMLFDEVTSALDPELTGEVLRAIEGLAADGMTMIMVTHEMSFARKIADKVIFMHQGRVREEGPSDILVNPSTPELKQFIGNEL
ncbi:ATP-binding cassette domain-containing protein [Candidatus Phyllobacterium onerii]|uniref:ATP-binding cassette domain-containing protein n=1 Tax=Candidatus Phyllobacterium onerii TaxID=3020828 RepID=UPI0023314004|nr:ATP-binding cassette domain-containing protein [Phyllobacterium sp. IY22]